MQFVIAICHLWKIIKKDVSHLYSVSSLQSLLIVHLIQGILLLLLFQQVASFNTVRTTCSHEVGELHNEKDKYTAMTEIFQ